MLRPQHLLAATGAALLSFGIARVADAQTILGTVMSGADPVVGASVRLAELDRVMRTGAHGEFSFTSVPRGRYRLFVSGTGYAPATDTVLVGADGGTANIRLVRSVVALRDIVVSASPIARTWEESYQSTAAKSRVELHESPGSSFAEKISDLPGVSVRGNGSAPSRPILRGLSDNEVLVLENGLRPGDIATYDPAHATPLEAISIARIEVVRGPATILYGPSTVGGVVNVITNLVPSVSDHSLSGTVSLEGNSVSSQSAGFVNTVLSAGRQAFSVSAGGVRAQDIRIPGGTYVDPGSGMAFRLDRLPQTFDRSGEAGIGYVIQGASGTIGLGARHYVMNYGVPGVPPNDNFIAVPPTTSRIEQRRNTVELRSAMVGDGALVEQWKLTASYNDYDHGEFPTAQDSTGVSSPQANHFHKRELNAVLQAQHHPFSGLQGTVGLWSNFERLSIDGDQPLGPNSSTTGLAAYAYEEYAITSGTGVQGAIRYDYNRIRTHPDASSPDSSFRLLNASRLSNAVTASLGGFHRLGSGITASVSVARSFRAPTVQELFGNGVDAASGTFSVGTPELGPETGLGVDASLKGTFDRVSFELSPFVNTIDHYIYGFLRGDTIQEFPVRQFAASRARLIGGEAALGVEPMTHVALRATTDYVRAEDIDRHVPLPFIPPFRGALRATFQDGTHMASAEWRGAAGQTRLGQGDTPTSGYAIVNLGAGVRLLDRAISHDISVHCDNVFNRVYRDHLSVIKDFLPQPARGFRVAYEMSF